MSDPRDEATPEAEALESWELAMAEDGYASAARWMPHPTTDTTTAPRRAA